MCGRSASTCWNMVLLWDDNQVVWVWGTLVRFPSNVSHHGLTVSVAVWGEKEWAGRRTCSCCWQALLSGP